MADNPLIVDGVKLNVTPDDFSDIEYLEQALISADETKPDGERVIASVRMLQIAFGADWQRVKDELRAKRGGGKLTLQELTEFTLHIGEAFAGKNS